MHSRRRLITGMFVVKNGTAESVRRREEVDVLHDEVPVPGGELVVHPPAADGRTLAAGYMWPLSFILLNNKDLIILIAPSVTRK